MSLSDDLFRGGVLGGSVVDHLASQGSLAYEREKGQLIAVNAGSSTTRGGARRRRPRAQRPRRRLDPGLPQHWLAAGADPNVAPRAGSRRRKFVTTPGQVAFTREGGKLLVTTKGNTGAIGLIKYVREHDAEEQAA